VKCAFLQRFSAATQIAGTYYSTSVLVVLATWVGEDHLPRRWYLDHESDFFGTFANWDGVWYSEIANDSYSYDVATASTVAFLPCYPAIARYVALLTGLSSEVALLFTSHASLIALMLLLLLPQCAMVLKPDSIRLHTLIVLALWPMGLFLRMAYSESLFLLLKLFGKSFPDEPGRVTQTQARSRLHHSGFDSSVLHVTCTDAFTELVVVAFPATP
jgi:hypothetical protein